MCNLVRESIGEYKLENAFELDEFIESVNQERVNIEKVNLERENNDKSI